MRRLLLVNALIFAVLAAAVALAYYGYSYTAEVALRDRELQLMKELAEEKVLAVESQILSDDEAILRQVRLDQLDKLNDQQRAAAGSISSIFVLDGHLQLLPGGSTSGPEFPVYTDPVERRDWYLKNIIPKLQLAKLPLNTTGHYYARRGETPYLLVYWRKQQGDSAYYVVVENNVNHIGYSLFPQVFVKLHYHVVDERDEVSYGMDLGYKPSDRDIAIPFSLTLDNWTLRFSDEDPAAEQQLRKKRIVDSLLIGGAVTIILAGLGFLVLAIRRERRANELKSDFISNVSHELKTPLSIITMFGEMLANKRTKSPEQATEYAEIIYRESVRLDRLIENVLDFAKIERGMGVYEFAEADVGEVVARAVDLAQRRAQTAELALELDVEPELPPVKLDANAFTLAVLNLVDNAIKYAADGKRVALSVKREGDRVVLAVRDWGPGIAPDEQARIFERFYRAKAMRLRPIRGSGIGLALVQHIARAHGGDVTLTSAPGAGSTFQIWLPMI